MKSISELIDDVERLAIAVGNLESKYERGRVWFKWDDLVKARKKLDKKRAKLDKRLIGIGEVI